MNPQVIRDRLGRIPDNHEFVLNGWQRVLSVSLPPDFQIGSKHPYIPDSTKESGLYPTYLNIERSPQSFVVGRVFKVTGDDLKLFDEFEGVSLGVMKRIELDNQELNDCSETLLAYVGQKEYIDLFKTAKRLDKTIVPEAYFSAVISAAKTLQTPLDRNDCLLSGAKF